MSRMQNGQIPIPLKRPSEESSTHSEDTTVHKYNYNHHSSDSNNNNNPPDIEKCQPYRGYRRHDDHDDDDDNDNDTEILSNASGDSIISSSRNGRQRSRVVMFYAASYVAFAILSFFSAAYYFLCWMPYEPSNSDPFPGRHR